MKQLIQKIICLPKLGLGQEQWDTITDIVGPLHNKTLFELEAVLSENKSLLQKNNIQPDDLIRIKNFIPAWQEMIELLLAWNQSLINLWTDIFNDTPGNDILLPLTIELMPQNKTALSRLLNKLDQALMIECHNEIGFTLTNLYGAVYSKLHPIKLTLSDDEKEEQKSIVLVAKEIQKQEEIVQELQFRYSILKEQLLKNIKDNLMYKYNMSYPANPQNNVSYRNSDEMNDAIVADLQENMRSSSKNDPVIHELFLKYFIVKDMYYTLHRKNTSSIHNLSEFLLKKSQHEHLLKDELSSYSSWSETLYSYMPVALSSMDILKPMGYTPRLSRFSPFFWRTQPKPTCSNTPSQNNEEVKITTPVV